jgi:hypothetical protein
MSTEPWVRIAEHLGQLAGVRLHEDRRGRRWCVSNRLVARQIDAELLLIRCDFAPRERLLESYVISGDLAAITAALDAAWEMQR